MIRSLLILLAIPFGLVLNAPVLADDAPPTSGSNEIEQPTVRARTAKNVLRAHLGASGGTGAACPLLADDPTLPLHLRKGAYTIDYDLGDLHVINELAFANEATRGSLVASVSPDGHRWTTALTCYLIPDFRRMRMNFVPSEARYVRFAFSIDEPGDVFSFGLFGLTVAADYEVEDTESAEDLEPEERQRLRDAAERDGAVFDIDLEEVSLTITPTEAIVPWVSSLRDRPAIAAQGQENNSILKLIDENAFTECEFDPVDPRPSARLDLLDTKNIRKVSVLYAQQPGTLTLRLLSSDGSEPQAAEHDRAEDAQESDDDAEEFVFEDREGTGKFSFRNLFARSRFVELIWEPALSTESTGDSGFSIMEVAVFEEGVRQVVLPRATIIPVTERRGTTESAAELTSAPTAGKEAVAPSQTAPAAPAAAAQPNVEAAFDLELDVTSF